MFGSLPGIEASGIERYARAANARIRAPTESQMQVDGLAQGGSRVFLETDQPLTANLVTQHNHIRLRTMQQREGHSGIRRMEQRALTLDDIPMICRGIRTQ